MHNYFKTLQFRLVAPFVGLLLAVTITIAMLSYWVGSRAYTGLAEELLVEKAGSVSMVVERHMYGSGAVLETAFPTGMAAKEDMLEELDAIKSRFWAATTLHTDPNDYVYFGNILGQNFGLKRLADNEVELRIRYDDQSHRRIYRQQSMSGIPVYQFTEPLMFQTRARPWFLLGQAIDQHTWTAVYVDFSSNDLVVTRARRVLDQQSEFIGVVATDVSLKQLNQFIGQLKITPNSRILLIEPDGGLIAASYTDNITTDPEGSIRRLNANEVEDEWASPALEALQEVFQQDSYDPVSKILTNHRGQKMQVVYKRVFDDAGLDWITIIIVPIKDVVADIKHTLWAIVFVGFVAVVIALIIGMKIFGRTGERIRILSRAMHRFAKGDYIIVPKDDRLDEIGQLFDGFQAMQEDLMKDLLTGCANRIAMERKIDHLIDDNHQLSNLRFALLFIDLNNFKPLNDTYGHENGDLALKETVDRLQRFLSPEDLLARLGGDEFVVVIESPQLIDEKQYINDVRVIIEQPLISLKHIPAGDKVTVSAAIGLAYYPEDGLDRTSLLKTADQRMYEDKLQPNTKYKSF